jgi:hypothetical protein
MLLNRIVRVNLRADFGHDIVFLALLSARVMSSVQVENSKKEVMPIQQALMPQAGVLIS